MEARLAEQLALRARKKRLRTLPPPSTTTHPRSTAAAAAAASIGTGDTIFELSSNDYLDLSSSNLLYNEFTTTLNRTANSGLASTGSRLLSGNSTLADDIERRAASFWATEDALLVNTGYEANVALFTTLPQASDVVIYDELVHASVFAGLNGCRCSRERRLAFRHNDLTSFETVLRQAILTLRTAAGVNTERCDGCVIVAIESVYSMDGDLAPWQEMVAISRRLRTLLQAEAIEVRFLIDEAHATGLYDDECGRGLSYPHLSRYSSTTNCYPEVLARLHTLGKGLAGTGALITCPSVVKSYLLNYAKGLIYSTFMSKPALALAAASLQLLTSGRLETRRLALWERVRHAESALQRLAGDVARRRGGVAATEFVVPARLRSPVVPIVCSDPLRLSQHLLSRGFRVMAIRYPTVPRGEERIRLCLRSEIPTDVIDGVVRALLEYLPAESARPPVPEASQSLSPVAKL